jgi:hypothetical protein
MTMRKAQVAGLLALGLAYVPAVAAGPPDAEAVSRAVDRGVAHLRALQREDGTWPEEPVGATALAGLALLECGAAADDRAVRKAAQAVRPASIRCTHTYSLSTAILFLDRLGDPADVPLIESMAVRLLAGQSARGGWGYTCPPIGDDEVRRLDALVRDRERLPGRGVPPPPDEKRPAGTVSPEIQRQLVLLARTAPPAVQFGGDNSNTLFATVALWVARRHGIPIGNALARVDARFRAVQQRGGVWGYRHPDGPEADPGTASAAMTCAGVLGLTLAHAEAASRERDPQIKARAIEKDIALAAGLAVLGKVVELPTDRIDEAVPQPAGKFFCFLWSLERVCVALDLETLNKIDWYAWGADSLLASQQPDGSWKGKYATCGADTCFALLFLRRANLTRDATRLLKGRLKDFKTRSPKGSPGPEDTPAARLADELVKAPPAEQEAILRKLQETRGVENTEALAFAIPRLGGEAQRKARAALAARLGRLKTESLARYLQDEEPEIRRAAALACASKGSKVFVPHLIRLLRDREEGVARTAHVALKELTGRDSGPDPADWEAWWAREGKE